MTFSAIFGLVWLAFALSWGIAALFWRRPSAGSFPLRQELPSRLLLVAGGLLFLVPAHRYEGPLRLWRVDFAAASICLALVIAGFALCWWARISLGGLWSGRIDTKADHRLIERGPYAVIRHPIYSGILLAILATLVVKGTAIGIAGAALIALGLWLKARHEERWLEAELPPGVYAAYRQRTAMFVPFVL